MNHNKKKISLVSLDPLAGASYKREVESLFGNDAEIELYSVRDGSAAGKLPKADLFAVSTDAYGSAEEVARHVPIDSEVMNIEVTFSWESLDRIWQIPKGMKVLLVNVTETMAREAITQLNALGVNHIELIPYYQGAVLDAELVKEIDTAITPGESRYVPDFIEQTIDCGHRPCSYGMMIEIALRLGLENLIDTDKFRRYSEIVASNHYSFDRMYARATRQESLFHILAESLDDGLIGVNDTGDIFVCNAVASRITRTAKDMVLGRKGSDVFPYIPFYKAIKEKRKLDARVIQLFEANVSLTVIPVMQKDDCIGAFASLQSFNEQENRQNELRRQLLQKGHYAKYTFDDVIGDSKAIIDTINLLRKMAQTESPVLLVGETGTGKEIMAHAVHNASKRAKRPFIAINVAAMPENLLESELFGYEDGAFTGAKKGGRPGLFEFAHHGTLFLDEVEGMSPAMQIKLLRVLQEGEIMRVGGSSIIHVDVRVVAATNEALEQKIEDGSFRKDLYYRLNALTVEIPPLRERGRDVFLLMDYFMKNNPAESSCRLSQETEEILEHYDWPGNIRELQNTAEYFKFLGKGVIEPCDLPPTMKKVIGDNRCNTRTDSASLRYNEADKADFAAVTAKGNADPADYAYEAGNKSKALIHTEQDLPVHFDSYEDARSFVLMELVKAADRRQSSGRDRIMAAAREQGYILSQKETRDILLELSNSGLVESSRGRGGSRLTQTGAELFRKQKSDN